MTHYPNAPHPQPWAAATDALADEITTVVPPRFPRSQGNPAGPWGPPAPRHHQRPSAPAHPVNTVLGGHTSGVSPQLSPPRAPWAPPAGPPTSHLIAPAYPGLYSPVMPPTYRRSRIALRKPSRTTLLAGTTGLLAAVIVMIVGVTAGGWFGTTQLNITAAQSTVSTLLADPANGFGTTISDVTCNHGQNPTVTKGATFTCTATIDGVPRQLTATFTDDNGNYDISAPQ